jgi:hypothetical protein
VRRFFHIAATPVVVVGIYSWLIVQAAKDARHMIARKLWPGPPIDFP